MKTWGLVNNKLIDIHISANKNLFSSKIMNLLIIIYKE